MASNGITIPNPSRSTKTVRKSTASEPRRGPEFSKVPADCLVIDWFVAKKRNEIGLCVLTAVGERPIKIAVDGSWLKREVAAIPVLAG